MIMAFPALKNSAGDGAEDAKGCGETEVFPILE